MPIVIEHRYRPRGACQTVFSVRAPEVLISGPAGTGKSRACLEKLNLMALKNAGMRGLICRKTATSLSSTALVTWKKFVAREAIDNGDVYYYGGSAQEPAAYRYKNGSTILICGLDNITKVMSSEFDVIYVQEATELTENDWESLTSRLRNWQVSFQQMLADCNPSYPTHWLKQRCDKGICVMLESRHEDNPMLFEEDGTLTEKGADYIAKLDRLSGVRNLRLRHGRWAAAEGIIFAEFSEAHIVQDIPYEPGTKLDAFNVPMEWSRYWSVDFGFTNPFVWQCWAQDPDGRIYLYREMYMTRKTVEQHCKKIMETVTSRGGKWLEPKPTAIVCDHDAEGMQVMETKLGMTTSPAHKSVLEGIDAVMTRMKDAGDGKPRLFILASALLEEDADLIDTGKPKCTLEEIPGYVWADKLKEQPVKADDHGCDAMRYVVAELDFGIRPIFRSFSVGYTR
jgi:phage terminase large subunit